MWMQTECRDGYKVRGLLEQKEAGWGITTWPEGKDEPEIEYWVKDEVFYRPKDDIAPIRAEDKKASFGALDVNVDPARKRRFITLIKKWDAQISHTSAPA